MKTRYTAIGIATAAAFALAPAFGQALPGTPLAGGFGNIDIVDGFNLLPGPVTPGDLVLRETATGGDLRTNWSDVVRFFSIPVTFQNAVSTVNVAYLMSDSEAGIPSIALLDLVTGTFLLPDALRTNNTFMQETLAGTGPSANITTFSPSTGTSYLVHSDAAPPSDSPDPAVVPQPGTLIVGGGGNPPPPKPFGALILIEGADEKASAFSPFNLVQGNVVVADGGDTITFAAAPLGGTNISAVSDAPEGSPAEVEFFTFFGDESYTSGFIVSIDPIPEPETYALMLAGLGALGWAARRRGRGGPK